MTDQINLTNLANLLDSPKISKFGRFLNNLPNPQFFDLSRILLHENLEFTWKVATLCQFDKMGLDSRYIGFFDFLVSSARDHWLVRYTPSVDNLIVLQIDESAWQWQPGASPRQVH